MSRNTIAAPWRNKARDERHFSRLKAELTFAFAAPDDAYVALTAPEVIARNAIPSDRERIA